MEILLLLLGYLLWSLCNGLIAYDQGRGFGWWAFGSLVVSPPIIWLYLVASPAPVVLEYQRKIINNLADIYKQGAEKAKE